ncbi:MAG: signal peptide peptidase SppA [Caulobacteraceae bacterium]|nr:signal peptide peptidase SppA [Caulobacteraceae bacterium]
MKQFLLTMAGVFAGLVLFFIGVPVVLIGALVSAAKPAPTPSAAVLQLDLRRGLTDQEPQSAFGLFGGQKLAVMSVVQALHRAETDDRVKGLFVRLPEGGVSPGEADELRLAFHRFEAAGKPVIAHSQGLYPAGAITSTYELGAAASQLWMQTGAPFQATGLATQDIFFKRFFDKYGVQVDFEQRYEFKNAVNSYLYSDYTAPHREAELSWMGAIYQSALDDAATDRKQDPAKLKALIEAGPYDAADALAKGLIDKIGEVRQAQQAAVDKAGDGAKLVEIDDYIRDGRDSSDGAGAPVVAVVNAEGEIATGPSGALGSNGINADDVANALYTAADDSEVKAIVFRVSSPGGSDTASEEILAAVDAAKAKKPVVVSMGTYGASGGYWIASGASAIVAEPTTLTGSIGVFGGKLVIGPALSNFGVDLRGLTVGGPYADADSSAQGFTPAQHAAFSASIDKVYAGFVSRVAAGRGLPVTRVQEIARGRVWTGAQAEPLGLVDEVGGFYQAVDKAKALAGISGSVHLKTVVAHKTLIETLQAAMGASSASMRTLGQVAWLMSDPRAQAALHQLTDASLRARGAGGDVLAQVPQF